MKTQQTQGLSSDSSSKSTTSKAYPTLPKLAFEYFKPKIDVIQAPKLPENSNYLSTFMLDFPHASVLDKVRTGCGATSVALNNEFDYIIAVPNKGLTVNKAVLGAEKGKHYLAVKGPDYSAPNGYKKRTSDEHIKQYLLSQSAKGEPRKILVTYDSLHRLEKHVDFSQFHLLVDECHELVRLAGTSERNNAINYVLNNLSRFKHYCLTTATIDPFLWEFPQLRDTRLVRVAWHPANIKQVRIERVIVHPKSHQLCKDKQAYNLIEHAVFKALNHLTGTSTGNGYIFINSVSFIIKVIKKLQALDGTTIGGVQLSFDPSKVRVIVGDTTENERKLVYQLGKGYAIGNSTDSPKTINFVTSCAFQGQDFFDIEGKTYIFSDGTSPFGKVDILTQVQQIAGRIRNTKFNEVIRIYTTPNTVASLESLNEYRNWLLRTYEKDLAYYNAQMNLYEGTANKQLQEAILFGLHKYAETTGCITLDTNGTPVMNRGFVGSMLRAKEHLQSNCVYIANTKTKNKPNTMIDRNPGIVDVAPVVPQRYEGFNLVGRPIRFDEAAAYYCKYFGKYNQENFLFEWDNQVLSAEAQNVKDIAIIYPEIKRFYELLGPRGMSAQKYRRKDMYKALQTLREHKQTRSEVEKQVVEVFGGNSWYPTSVIKSKLSEIYAEVDRNQKPKATDILLYFNAKRASKRMDGKRVSGYSLGEPLYLTRESTPSSSEVHLE